MQKPFQAVVGSNGSASLQVRHDIHGLAWKVYQIGLSLNQFSSNAQVAAHVNGLPLSGAVFMQQCSFPDVPYQMESYFIGPPYIILRAGDVITCSVKNAIAGDIFTAGAYVDERPAEVNLSMGN